ncbi:hypothetical protein LTS10_011760 [Elasticomyces elasticus]|nr:hypothetical protein LTS10_011760 [Elasticomyces elasticus]
MATPISDRYRRYKAGTTKITDWLKKAARGCVGVEKTPDMTTQGLIKLANAIASSTQPEVEIPLEILVVIEDVIGGRQASAEWYTSTTGGGDDATKQANCSHRKFIDVLKQVLSVLRSKYEDRLPRWEKKKPAKLDQEKARILENIYQYLDVEEPKTQPLGTSPSGRDDSHGGSPLGQSQPSRIASKTLATDLAEADKIFALWCFFKDQYDSCNFLKDAWQEYLSGPLSFPSVCQITDTAFMLMGRASTSLVAEYPEFSDMRNIDVFLGFEKMTIDGKLTIVAFRECKADANAKSQPALHELFCTKASCIMEDFRDMMCSNVSRAPGTRNLSNGFAPALYALAPEIELLAQCDLMSNKPKKHIARVHEDHFLDGLVLDLQVLRGHQELHKLAPRLADNMAKHKQYMESLQGFEWPPNQVIGLNFFREHLLRQVKTDIIQQLQSGFPIEELRGPSPDFRMQKHLPVTCGTLLFLTQQGCHVLGVLDSNTGLVMLAAAHLYKAARLSGVLADDWKDMEWFCAQHNQPRPFVLAAGKSAQPLSASAKHYLVALGMKPSAELAFRWHTPHDGSSPRFRCAEMPTSNRIVKDGRILGAGSCSPYLNHLFDEAKNNTAYTRGATPWSSLQELVLHKVANAIMRKQRPQIDAQPSNKLTATQLLTGFKQMLRDDEVNFNFDYFGFLRDCCELMDRIVTACDPTGPSGAMAALRLVNVILWQGAATEKYNSGVVLLRTMLSRCGTLLATHITRRGSVHVDNAALRCATHEVVDTGPTSTTLRGALGQMPGLGMDPKLFLDLKTALKT